MAKTKRDGAIIDVEEKKAKNESEYLRITIRTDDKQHCSFNVWQEVENVKKILKPGTIWTFLCDWDAEYVNLISYEKNNRNEEEFYNHLFTTQEKAQNYLDYLLSKIKDEDFIKLNNAIFNTKGNIRYSFINAPGATTHHHIELGGLLQHTGEVMEFIETLSHNSSYSEVNFQVALEGALLHDIGKIYDYSYGLFQKTEITRYYLLGEHLSIGAELIGYYSSVMGMNTRHKLDSIQHIIRSHHLRRDWDAVVPPVTLEAYLVYLGDTWSTNLNKFRHCTFKNRIGTLNGRSYFVDLSTPYE